MLTITKIFQFSAAHKLPNYDGACKRWHGHSFKLEVTVRGDKIKTGPKTGMIMDFGDLKELVQTVVLDSHDHHSLNDLYENPTAEIMVKKIYGLIANSLIPNISLVKVRLWESDTAYAEYGGAIN